MSVMNGTTILEVTVMATVNKVSTLLRLTVHEHHDYENYVMRLSEVGMVENCWKNNVLLSTYGDGSIHAIKIWHDTPTKTGVACVIERFVGVDNTTIESVEFYQYAGSPDHHRRLVVSEDKSIDFMKYIEELIEAGVIDWRVD